MTFQVNFAYFIGQLEIQFNLDSFRFRTLVQAAVRHNFETHRYRALQSLTIRRPCLWRARPRIRQILILFIILNVKCGEL